MSEALWMPLRSAVVSRVLRYGFPPSSNPAVENATCTLRAYADINKFWDQVHKTRVVISAIKHKNTYAYHFASLHTTNATCTTRSLGSKVWVTERNRAISGRTTRIESAPERCFTLYYSCVSTPVLVTDRGIYQSRSQEQRIKFDPQNSIENQTSWTWVS